MNQQEAPVCARALAAESMKAPSNNAASPQHKRFPPSPPFDLSEAHSTLKDAAYDHPEVDQDDDDEQDGSKMGGGNQNGCDGTFCCPIVCKPSNAQSSTLSPTSVTTLDRDGDKLDEPSWSIQEFQEYLGMLEMLREVSGDSEDEEVKLSVDSIGQMERLLTSLLLPGTQL